MTTGRITFRLRSVLNFRDVGGIEIAGGKRMKSGLLFRSATPDRISRKDIRLVTGLGIKTIIDLRAPREVHSKRRIIDGAEIISLPLDFEQKTRDKLKPLIYRKNSEESINAISNEIYLEILDASLPAVKMTAEKILDPGSRSILIHCQAGKDRTGILAAIIQLAAGAQRQTVTDEYLRSNEELIPFFRRMLLLRKIITFGFFPSGTILYVITVKKRNMDSVIDRIENHYGGIESFLKLSGLTGDQIVNLRRVLSEN